MASKDYGVVAIIISGNKVVDSKEVVSKEEE